MAGKKITELTQANAVTDSDLFIVETANGTCSIPYSEIKKMFQNMLETETNTGDTKSFPFVDCAASHNGIFRGKDLTNVYTIDEICERISNGTFEDLYIGDYFDVTINAEGSEVVRCILAGFNMCLYNNDISFTSNHAVIVTKNCLTTTHSMNPTNTTVGGFAGSDMWETVIPLYNTAFGSVFGRHLLSHITLLTKVMNADLASNAGAGLKGASSDWGAYDTKLSLLSEIQVYGSKVFSSSFYDIGSDNLQFPLFALDPTARISGSGGTGNVNTLQWYWLRNVASASRFASIDSGGASSYSDASGNLGVRPYFLIG